MSVVEDPRIAALAGQGDGEHLAEKVQRDPGAFMLDDVLGELARSVDKPDVTFPVRTRPGWAVRFSTRVDADEVKAWTKAATVDGDVDLFQLQLLTLAGQCRSLVRNGQDLGATFGHEQIMGLYGAVLVAECVRSFYGDDTLVTSTYASLLEHTGAGERLDPTTGSSG
jgi:hypothetical protein